MTPLYGLFVNVLLMAIAIWSISEDLITSKIHLQQTRTSISSKGIRIILCALGFVLISLWKDCSYDKTQKDEALRATLAFKAGASFRRVFFFI